MTAIKFEYIFKNITEDRVELVKQIYSLDEIEEGVDYNNDILVCRRLFAGLKDKSGKRIFEGDLREIEGKLYKLVNDGWRFRFERNLVEFGQNENIVLDEDSAYISVFRGTIYENPELLRR